jgi:putative ABC transport system permease protein
VHDVNQLHAAVDEATGLMRNIRRLPLSRETDFDVRMSDAAANNTIEQLSFITLAATFIGLITLLGAGIGLMNIMLVLVTERTREIGVSKALGATKANIRMQFLTEAVLICQMGGALGIILGIAIGNLVSVFFESGFIVPWGWVIGGIVFCFAVGIAAGIYPAVKASNLDPIDALRYE